MTCHLKQQKIMDKKKKLCVCMCVCVCVYIYIYITHGGNNNYYVRYFINIQFNFLKQFESRGNDER